MFTSHATLRLLAAAALGEASMCDGAPSGRVTSMVYLANTTYLISLLASMR
jgi:hypothetical protein